MDSGLQLRAALYIAGLLIGLLILWRAHSRTVRQVLLLAVSYALYVTWGAWFLAVLLASTAMNFLVGRWMRRNPSVAVLWAGLTLNIVLLAFFKYLPAVTVNIPLESLQKLSHIALPLGISFWTFQAMSYLLDLYRGEELDPSLLEFALYMAFFPVVVSGPICRLPDMLPQFRLVDSPSRHDVGRGVCRIATGVLMMEMAQLLGKGILSGQGIDAGFDQMTGWSGPDVWCLALGYALQIFFDFAGYSHIAIGAARMLGFNVPENFAHPFTSPTPSIFWTRWHMSLSFWIRDYVFMPLAVLRREEWWRKFCLLVAMVLFGIWHKATMLFVLFGCYHGVLLILHRQVQQVERRFNWEPPEKIWRALSWMTTMALVNLGWIFFRADSLTQAGKMFSALFSAAGYADHSLPQSLYLLVAGSAAAYAVALFVVDRLDDYAGRLDAMPPEQRPEAMSIALRDRWLWIAPMWTTACVLVLTLIPHQSRAANVFLYRYF
jgi:alginate O-acetyltransferase complex protein AlgI